MPLPLAHRTWLIPAAIAAFALGACATGLAPCSIAKPIGLIARPRRGAARRLRGRPGQQRRLAVRQRATGGPPAVGAGGTLRRSRPGAPNARPQVQSSAPRAREPTLSTPARQQYLDLKQQYPDAVLLFRMGDFYETFDDDAKLAADVLGIALTSRPMGRGEGRIPLAGVPHHQLGALPGPAGERGAPRGDLRADEPAALAGRAEGPGRAARGTRGHARHRRRRDRCWRRVTTTGSSRSRRPSAWPARRAGAWPHAT